MRNAGLEETPAGIKIAGRYADDTTLMAESEEELKSLLPLSMGFPRQKYWCGLAFPPSGDLPDPKIKHTCSAFQAGSLSLNHMRSPKVI